jgi:hypothetical protein
MSKLLLGVGIAIDIYQVLRREELLSSCPSEHIKVVLKVRHDMIFGGGGLGGGKKFSGQIPVWHQQSAIVLGVTASHARAVSFIASS